MRPIAPHLPGGRLNFTSPTDPFFITLKLAFIVGVVMTSPYTVYQIWAFLSPALYEREKRLVLPALFSGLILFLGGAAAGYLLALPHALNFLLAFQNQSLQPIITADRYFTFAAQVIVAVGCTTELPLVIIILAALGLVTPTCLRKNRRFALLGAAVFAAFLAPPDALSMIIGIIVLMLFYEIGIWCAWIVLRRKARAARRASAAVAALVVALALPERDLTAQQPVRRDTTRRADSGVVAGRALDTAAARRLGLPTGPTRTFPAADPVMDSLLS
jgi:sec-independent protein translocase protein TatC